MQTPPFASHWSADLLKFPRLPVVIRITRIMTVSAIAATTIVFIEIDCALLFIFPPLYYWIISGYVFKSFGLISICTDTKKLLSAEQKVCNKIRAAPFQNKART